MSDMEKYKFRKKEAERYDRLIDYIRCEAKTGRDFWASLFSGGLTFTGDIMRFAHYAEQVGATDISEQILADGKIKI